MTKTVHFPAFIREERQKPSPIRPESETAQPLLRIKGCPVFINAEPQLRNAVTVGHDFADFFVGGDFLPGPNKDLFQAGINRKIVAVINNNGVANGGHDRHRANFTFENRPDFLPLLRLNVYSFILKYNSLHDTVSLATKTQRHES